MRNIHHKITILVCSVFFTVTHLFSQELTELKTYPVSQQATWMVDGLENIIVSDRDRLTKYDKNGKLLFEQSQKSIGRIDKIELVNSLKIYGFSENQQLICFYDNSLSSMEKCLDLSEYDLVNVSTVASSGQSDKMWAFDQVNSSLHLLSFKGLLQSQNVKNLSGILNADNIIQLLESENKLFVLDNQKGVYVFDVYGTLIRFFEVENVKWIQLRNDYIICLKDNQFQFISLTTDKQPFDFPLNYQNVADFYVDDAFIYLRTPESIIKTQLVFK
jgi:hypothetical protein